MTHECLQAFWHVGIVLLECMASVIVLGAVILFIAERRAR